MSGRITLALTLLITTGVLAAQTPLSTQSAQGVQSAVRLHPVRGKLEDRVATYTRALGLDAHQQQQLTTVLLWQREQVQRLWNDSTMPSVQRIQATRAIGDATADRIRAMLTEEQRKKYNPARPPREKTLGASGPSVEEWMRSAGSQ
jgi:hypothetical protein